MKYLIVPIYKEKNAKLLTNYKENIIRGTKVIFEKAKDNGTDMMIELNNVWRKTQFDGAFAETYYKYYYFDDKKEGLLVQSKLKDNITSYGDENQIKFSLKECTEILDT